MFRPICGTMYPVSNVVVLRISNEEVSMKAKILPEFQAYSLAEAKRRSIQLYAYTNRLAALLTGYLPDHTLLALFDSNACLLKLYGAPESLSALQSQYGLKRMTDWSADAIGKNPVSEGLEKDRVFSSADIPLLLPSLKGLSVFFSPCTAKGAEQDSEIYAIGGIALITDSAHQEGNLLLTAIAASNDVSLHLFMAQSLNKACYSEENGMITIDINMATGKKFIIYHDSNIFNLFDIPEKDISFCPAESFFDPLPFNQEFWRIISENRMVNNQMVDISVHGRTETYQITTDPYWREDLSIRGIHIYVVSRRSLLTRISRNIGYKADTTFENIVGQSPALLNTARKAKAIARTDNNVLIIGETGTGKDILAQCIHNAGSRAKGPFVVVNCAAYPAEMLSQTLFGNPDSEDDDMLDATGLLELANNGTILINDIEALPLSVQSALLQFIETKTYILKHKLITADVKIIAASSADLVSLTLEKKFRPDLYYLLNTLHLRIPPLRERSADIPILAEHFVSQFRENNGIEQEISLSSSAKRLVSRLAWNGNVRELRNTMEGIIQIYSHIEEITPHQIIDYMGSSGTLPHTYESYENYLEPGTRLLTKEIIEDALSSCRFNKTETARRLGISRKTLYRYEEKIGISQ